jgi:CxxC-x17-CxxC domain-containing protein
MAASILHFGQELGNRFPLLRNAGYSINRYGTIVEFSDALQSGEFDAVSLSDLDDEASPLVVRTARTHSTAPLILFRTRDVISFPNGEEKPAGDEANQEKDFDLVIPVGASPRAWIGDIAALIARSRDIRLRSRQLVERSQHLREEVEAVTAKTRFEVARGRQECARNAEADTAWNALSDKLLRCGSCGAEFVFSAGEQLFFQKRHFINDPKRCRKCRTERKSGSSFARPEISVTCAECGVFTTVPFKPRQGRPVLCRSCFETHRLPPPQGNYLPGPA